jgi:hypothetical protein
MWPTVPNTLAYYHTVLITAVKYFHSAGAVFTKLFSSQLTNGTIKLE